MSTSGLVYNLTGRPLRARCSARAIKKSLDPTRRSVPFVMDTPITFVPFTDGVRQSGSRYGVHDSAGAVVLLPQPAHCIGCGVDLGEANARQYCAKTHCPFFA
ncbi:hypothetical protein pkur_cds_190 [Pandoravirus kuranda]|uniref:Uncharacterized protein n=1 Tax=Pandoravirus kuranda TaxID=3019033 RepID=A0AA95EEC4_9VIRU|nr:hypothetical protein pkur_cds_190 [Pandoravirus kuranda]